MRVVVMKKHEDFVGCPEIRQDELPAAEVVHQAAHGCIDRGHEFPGFLHRGSGDHSDESASTQCAACSRYARS